MLDRVRGRSPWTIELRRCQREAVEAWLLQTPDDALIRITPGGGKSLIMARLAHVLLESGSVGRVIPVVPTDYLRTQLAELLCSVGVRVTDDYRPMMGRLPRHLDGVVTTYQQVAADPETFAKLSVGAFAPFDEIHHAASHATWGRALEHAFAPARHRLALTGTDYRADEARISFIPYHLGESKPLYAYSYLDALRDGVVRPVEFKVFGAKVKWRSSDGVERETETSAPCTSPDELAERLRALLWSDEWIRHVISEAHARLTEIRGDEQPDAAGLVCAIDMAHARHIAQVIATVTGRTPVVALSDDPASTKKIAAFRDSNDRWIVAVRQISEGVDIPRVRVPVHMSNITTRLFFDQFIPRGLRYQSDVGGEQLATAYIPEDIRILAHAHTFTESVRAWMKEKAVGTSALMSAGGEGGSPASKFQVLETSSYSAGTVRPVQAAFAQAGAAGVTVAAAGTVVAIGDLRQKRERVQQLVTAVARATGYEYKKLHGLLKRRCGGSLPMASDAQLESRLRLLASWLKKGRVT